MRVQVVNYKKEWPVLFQEEKAQIKRILSNELIEVYHIGSTSVENMMAKPVIDIMPVVRDISKVNDFNREFIALGYEPKGEFGITGRRFFIKGALTRTHHIHIFGKTNYKDIERHLAVRDYLRNHPYDALAYGKLKISLAGMFPEDIESYCEGKDNFVKELEKRALKWFYDYVGDIENPRGGVRGVIPEKRIY